MRLSKLGFLLIIFLKLSITAAYSTTAELPQIASLGELLPEDISTISTLQDHISKTLAYWKNHGIKTTKPLDHIVYLGNLKRTTLIDAIKVFSPHLPDPEAHIRKACTHFACNDMASLLNLYGYPHPLTPQQALTLINENKPLSPFAEPQIRYGYYFRKNKTNSAKGWDPQSFEHLILFSSHEQTATNYSVLRSPIVSAHEIGHHIIASIFDLKTFNRPEYIGLHEAIADYLAYSAWPNVNLSSITSNLNYDHIETLTNLTSYELQKLLAQPIVQFLWKIRMLVPADAEQMDIIFVASLYELQNELQNTLQTATINDPILDFIKIYLSKIKEIKPRIFSDVQREAQHLKQEIDKFRERFLEKTPCTI